LFNAPFEWPARYAELYWACTANLSVDRRDFETTGGFDEETYTVVGGEDVDFCLRLQDAGFAILSQPDALAVHTRTLMSSFGDMASKMLLYGRTSVYNTMRHPHHRGFHPNPAVLLPLAVASLPARRARRAVALAAGVWFGAQSASLMARTRRISPLALPAVVLEWVFDAGIALEAVGRGRVTEALWRFRYFDDRLYRPFDHADAGRA
jgi:GT2 family glycosyltransferase